MRCLVLWSILHSTNSVPQADSLASLSLSFLVCKIELRLSVLMKRNSVKRILGTYLEPTVCKIQFVPLNLGWQIGCNLKEK